MAGIDLGAINQSVLRLIDNSARKVVFIKDFTSVTAKDVSITTINADGSESSRTFPNIAKMVATYNITNDNGAIKDMDGNLLFTNKISSTDITYDGDGNAIFQRNIQINKNGAYATYLLEYKGNPNSAGSGYYESKVIGFLCFTGYYDGSNVQLKMDFVELFNKTGGLSGSDDPITVTCKFLDSDSNVINNDKDGNYTLSLTFSDASTNYSKIALRDISENLTLAQGV